jgi:hypothetical protein
MNAQDLIDLSVQQNRTVTEYPEREEAGDLIDSLRVECSDDCPVEHISGQGYSGLEGAGYYDIWGTTEDGDDWRVHVVTQEIK